MKLNKKAIVAVLTAILGVVGLLLKFAEQLPESAEEVHGGAPAVEFVAPDAGATDAGK